MEHSQPLVKKPVLKKEKGKRRVISEKLVPHLFILPAMLFLFIFVLLPLIMSFVLSLTDSNLISASFNWVGLDNYSRLLSDPTFWQVVKNTFIFGFVSVSVTVILATILANFLDRKIRGINFLKGIFFLPYITPMVAISIVWIWLFDQHFGLINWFIGLFNIPQIPWLTQPGWAMAAIIIMKIWKVVGYYTIILIAGLQNIPDDIYEAARIDGAGEFKIFMKIKLPLLSPSLLFVMIVAIIASFQDFDQIYTMTQGGPADSTNMIIYYLYQYGFEFFEAGYASSVSVVLFITLFFITWLQAHLSRKWVHY